MAYRFESADRDLEEGFRRIALEQIDRALASLDKAAARPVWAIHDLRKRCKRLRGLIRLVRTCFEGWRTEDARLRDVARLLAGRRDRDVFFGTFAMLTESSRAARHAEAIRHAKAVLRKSFGKPDRGNDDAAVQEVRTAFEEMRPRAERWRLERPGWRGVCGGSSRTYRRARQAMNRAALNPTAEHHHEWRKHVEHHWFHVRLLQRIWPAVTDRIAPAERLSGLLGEHHDLAVFEAHVRDTLDLDDPAHVPLIALAQERRRATERKAHLEGLQLFAEPAGQWRERCKAWRQEIGRTATGEA